MEYALNFFHSKREGMLLVVGTEFESTVQALGDKEYNCDEVGRKSSSISPYSFSSHCFTILLALTSNQRQILFLDAGWGASPQNLRRLASLEDEASEANWGGVVVVAEAGQELRFLQSRRWLRR